MSEDAETVLSQLHVCRSHVAAVHAHLCHLQMLVMAARVSAAQEELTQAIELLAGKPIDSFAKELPMARPPRLRFQHGD